MSSGIALRAALRRALAEVEARLKALDVPAPDTQGDDADRVVFREEHEGQVLSRVFLIERRRLILAALARIETGRYGRCLDCDGVVPATRLHAIPWAERDVACEIRWEQARATRRAGASREPEPEPEDEA